MNIKTIKTIKKIITFIVSLFIISISCITIAGPDLEKDIKKDLLIYINHLNNGNISQYYEIYNTRKLTDIEKSLFYDKIKNATKIVNSEKETFKKFKLKVQIEDVKILNKINQNIYLCNIKVYYQIRENINTTKTIKKSDEYILKILDTGTDGYKILLPFNSMDKEFSESNLFVHLEQIYKNKKAKEVEEKRLTQENTEEIENIEKANTIDIDANDNNHNDKEIEDNYTEENSDDNKNYNEEESVYDTKN